jgi:hypothetical protein
MDISQDSRMQTNTKKENTKKEMIGWLSEALTDCSNSSYCTCTTPTGSLLKSLTSKVSTSYFYIEIIKASIGGIGLKLKWHFNFDRRRFQMVIDSSNPNSIKLTHELTNIKRKKYLATDKKVFHR